MGGLCVLCPETRLLQTARPGAKLDSARETSRGSNLRR